MPQLSYWDGSHWRMDVCEIMCAMPQIDDPHRLVFAFGGALAHVNATIRSERLRVAGTVQRLALEAA